MNSITTTPAHAAPPDAPLAVLSDEARRATRFAIFVLIAGLGGFFAWAAFAPLDEGVPSQGMVVIDTKRKAVQHPTGGIVKEVLVREGDRVKEGQPLLRLDQASSKAAFESMRQRYLSLRSVQGRLQAQQSGAAVIDFHPELKAAAEADPLIRQQLRTQEQLFTATRSAQQAELQALQEGIRGQDGLLQSYDAMHSSRRNQLNIATEELANMRKLVTEGFAPRTRQLELERMVAESQTNVAEMQGNMQRARQSAAEMRQRHRQRELEIRKDIEAQLAEVSRDVESDEGKFRALADDLERIEVRAPASGQVVGLSVQSVGAVIQSGLKLMDIVPENEPLLVETRVPPHLVDSIRPGLDVDVRFSAFAHAPQLVLEGKLASVSGDLLNDGPNTQPYYLARVKLSAAAMQALGKRTLQPGMPVEVVLKTGERSLLTYLLHPLTKRLAGAMKEQ